MAKYPDTIISLRKLAKNELLKILEKDSNTLKPIYNIIQKKFPKNCDNSILCTCGNNETSRSEWKHQVRWALQDLRYTNKLNYDEKTREYSLR